ncbi:hypothetical protein AC579_8938 [Pseudocercospora musae]|uniref:Uncharacterized protein n=1 Tax=Pseudocercospora musae TaxID=113226 RepID=A0A139H8M3_9PEZI|nr:hypothetical protein AC579_8938 [Pseudocercospora musae]
MVSEKELAATGTLPTIRSAHVKLSRVKDETIHASHVLVRRAAILLQMPQKAELVVLDKWRWRGAFDLMRQDGRASAGTAYERPADQALKKYLSLHDNIFPSCMSGVKCCEAVQVSAACYVIAFDKMRSEASWYKLPGTDRVPSCSYCFKVQAAHKLTREWSVRRRIVAQDVV